MDSLLNIFISCFLKSERRTLDDKSLNLKTRLLSLLVHAFLNYLLPRLRRFAVDKNKKSMKALLLIFDLSNFGLKTALNKKIFVL